MATEDHTAERWLPVVGFERLYAVSSLGRVRSVSSGRVRKLSMRRSGYLEVTLCCGGRMTFPRVHRLVLESFCRPAKPGEVCNHKNFVRDDNRIENLEWVTQQENCAHAAASGRVADVRGERHGSAKLTEKAVLEIRKRAASGERKTVLAAEYGVCVSTIYGVCSRAKRIWTHI